MKVRGNVSYLINGQRLNTEINMEYIRGNFEKFLVGMRLVQDQKCVEGQSKISELYIVATG